MQFGNRTLRASKTVDTIVVENYAGRKVLWCWFLWLYTDISCCFH
jgi:hypothetical protein